MRLAFSSLSCPTWTLEQIVRAAIENGYDGVELRGLGSHMNLPEAPEFAPEQRHAVRARFADSGLAICCLGSSARFADPAHREASRKELKTYMELAADLGCPFVRTFGGNIPQGTSRQEAVHAVAEELNALAPFAKQHGVSILLETHDAFSTGAQVAEVLALVEADAIGALWDLYHPFHHEEPASVSYDMLHPYIRHTHVKDGREGVYCLLGDGDTPVPEMLRLLLSPVEGGRANTDSLSVSVEWEKRWIADLAEPEVVLPQYARVLRRYCEEIIDDSPG